MNIDEILDKVPEKEFANMTTSKKFKRDLFEFFDKPEWKDKIAVEFGCFEGKTTIVLVNLFYHVYCFDNWDFSIESSSAFLKYHGFENVTFIKQDLYDGSPLQKTEGDVIFIDSKHNYEGVKSDIERFLTFKSSGKKYFVMDDYGICPDIIQCVDEFMAKNILTIEKKIGRVVGDEHIGHLHDSEGIILREV